MSDLKIKIAKRRGEFVTPDTPQLDSGSKCGCVCIGCDKPLVLKRGKVRQSHFSHPPRTACTIHDIVKGWIAQALLGQILTLPKHPGLITPRRFFACKDGAQVEFSERNRRYDVRLEVMPIMDFKRAIVPEIYKVFYKQLDKYYEPFCGGDVEHDWLLAAYLMKRNKIGLQKRIDWERHVPMFRKMLLRFGEIADYASGLNERDFKKSRYAHMREKMFSPQILPEFYAGRTEISKKMDPKLKARLRERTPSFESLDHIIIEVRDSTDFADVLLLNVEHLMLDLGLQPKRGRCGCL